ncbi:Uncharacterised protein [Segatella copri]|nr:Uncharacterised protein [Segatella copri]
MNSMKFILSTSRISSFSVAYLSKKRCSTRA